jgi:hypothetical protein
VLVGALLIAALTTAGCATVVPTIPPSGPAPLASESAAAQLLAAAVTTLSTTSYQVRVTQSHGRLVGSGTVLPALKSFDVRRATQVEGDALVESARMIRGTLWLNVDYAELNAQLRVTSQQWITATPSLLKAGSDSPFDIAGTDPFDIAGLLAGVTSVGKQDARHLVGTINYLRCHGVSAPDVDELSEAGDAAGSTPFLATLDANGRLVALDIDADGYNPDLTRMVALSGYGTVPAPVRPAATAIVAATPAVYQLFNEG